MAADKKSLQRDALKQVQAGKIDKAIETYRAMVKLDPKDAAVRNALGDLLRQAEQEEGRDRRVPRGLRPLREGRSACARSRSARRSSSSTPSSGGCG